jgi:hypothetical protein
VHNQTDHRDDKQQVNQPARYFECDEAQHPKDDQNEKQD